MTDGAAPAPAAGAPTPPAPAQPSTNGAAPPEGTAPAAGADHQAENVALTERLRQGAIEQGKRDRRIRELEAAAKTSGTAAEEHAAFIERLKADPSGVHDELGISHDSYINARLEQDKPPPSEQELTIQRQGKRIDELVAAAEKRAETETTATNDAARTKRAGVVSQFLEQGGEDTSAMHALGMGDRALAALEAHEAENGGLDNEAAANFIRSHEQNVRANVAADIKAIAALPWARELFTVALKPADTTDGQPADTATKHRPGSSARSSRKPKTVTNDDASAVTGDRDAPAPLTRRQRSARAAERVERKRAGG